MNNPLFKIELHFGPSDLIFYSIKFVLLTGVDKRVHGHEAELI